MTSLINQESPKYIQIDSGTHPYASVAGSEVRLVLAYISKGIIEFGMYLSDTGAGQLYS